MSCEHDCPPVPAFPAEIENRPALDQIAYRIGNYSRFRSHLLTLLDQNHALEAWTHRGADDPGIALLECGAVASEILAFYQELYANETYLRTARWRESVARLVALGGYRLASGLGGQASFALAVKGTDAVTVSAGFAFKAELEDADVPAIFQSLGEHTAYPWLSQFNLYRPRLGATVISTGTTRLELTAVDGLKDLASREAVDLTPGDRLIIVPRDNPWETDSKDLDHQTRSEILIIKDVQTLLDRIVIELEGNLAIDRGVEIDVYPIGRSFRHFGHDAPTSTGTLNEDTGIMNLSPTNFLRPASEKVIDDTGFYSNLDAREFPIDTEVDDLAIGGPIVITGDLSQLIPYDPNLPKSGFSNFGRGTSGSLGGFNSLGASKSPNRIITIPVNSALTVVRQIDSIHQDTLIWGGQNAGASVLTLTEELSLNPNITVGSYDIRRLQLHEVIGPQLTLRAESRWKDGDFELDTELNFFGMHAEAVTLAGRELFFEDDAGVLQSVRVVSEAGDFDLTGRDEHNPWLWSVLLDQPPRYPRESFEETDNRVTVYGNLVHCNQGERQDEAVLGGGDARRIFQTFALPKAPLTYLLHNERTPPQVPELEVYVDGILWQRVETFFSSTPNDRVYVVREDKDGNSLVQFGDGKTGARLPSGVGNVRARYRTGTGAYGPLKADKTPKAIDRLQPLTKLWMPQPATGGADAETEDTAREAAPPRLQSLGRLVSLADYEAEALSLPGVRKARADWQAPNGMPRLQLVVLTDGATETEAQAVNAAMEAANRCRGAARFPIETIQGLRQYLHLDLTIAYAVDRLAEDVEPAVRTALGVEHGPDEPQQGLFGFSDRQFGQGAHVSQVIAAAQQVTGVVWVRVDAFQAIPLGNPPQTDPLALSVPSNRVRHLHAYCPAYALLALHSDHLYLNLTQESAAKECEP